MLHLLPAEIALQVVSYLPIQSVHKITQVSHAWHDLIAVNENAVYRNAAILHRLVYESDCGDLALQPPRSGTNWKSFCRREFQMEWGWRGKVPPCIEELPASGTSVHRIKVDEDLGLVITTGQRGGLLVTDLKGNTPLWGLPPSHVAEYAHCEYDHGYIIFNRHDNCKEVWRRALDSPNEDHCTLSPPDSDMLSAWTDGIPRWHASTRHGHFRPWALLRMPEHTRAFRLSHLTLLASAAENAYLWDVSQGRLVETIGSIQKRYHHQTLGHIHYVEVNDKYAFICGSNQLRIFERGGGALVYDLSPRDLLRKVWSVEEHPPFDSSVVKCQKLVEKDLNSTTDDQFMAVHVSGNGKDIAVLTICGVLIIIPGFQRIISGEALLPDIAVQLRFPPSSGGLQDTAIYLALREKDGKVAVVTRKGLYLVSPEVEFSTLTAERPPRPGVVVSSLTNFEDSRLLSFVSCLQITRTGVYFNWKPS
ncbi:hypothetical protein F5J12DRAFT_685805, partial [Pisolithus orientalis]|uniref:uncharacterized protein n=1 Tax=Pisolithus orientalis TaxID=936130 RepID=UPI0022253A87